MSDPAGYESYRAGLDTVDQLVTIKEAYGEMLHAIDDCRRGLIAAGIDTGHSAVLVLDRAIIPLESTCASVAAELDRREQR